MAQSTNTDIREIKNAVDANSKAIGDLVTSISGLREDMRVGFSELRGQINSIETKLEGKIETVNAKLSSLESSTAKIPDLAEKVGELKNWKQIAIIAITGSFSGAIAWFVRGGYH